MSDQQVGCGGALVGLIVVLAWSVFYASACAVPRYYECRRVHPRWYCLMEQSR